MNKIAITLAALSVPAAAMAQDTMDTDGDGLVSYDEMAVAYPDLTEDIYALIDTDADGGVSEEEMQAAVDAGVIMPPETDS